MSLPNPFPLNIAEKQDTFEKLQLMANVPDEFKYLAGDFNKFLAGLNWMYENLPATAGTAVEKRYTTIAAMLADQAGQSAGKFMFVTDATADPEVASGYAYYEKLESSTGALTDYKRVSAEDLTAAGHRGNLTIAETPTGNGWWFASQTGTYTNAGGLVVDLSEGLTILSYNGSAWTKAVVPLDLGGYTTTETLLTYLLDGYSESDSNLFQSADYVVERVLSDGVTKTTYAAGTYQTAVAGGLLVDVTTAGSEANKHFLNTTIVRDINKSYSLNIELYTNNGVAGDAAGLAFNNAGQYTFIFIRTDGRVFTGSVGNTNGGVVERKGSNLKPYSTGDEVNFKFYKNQLSIFINGLFYFSYEINSDYEGEIHFMQQAFSGWVFNLDTDFVTRPSESNFFEYDTIGNNPFDGRTGLITFYQKIKNSQYVGYRIGRFKDSRDLVYADCWNILNAPLFDWNGYFMYQTNKIALAAGNSEFALKENETKDDFVAGNHGDELFTEFKVYLNGVLQSIDNDVTLVSCDTMNLMQKSTLHSAPESGVHITGHPEIATRIKYLKFENKGYNIFNRITFTLSQLIAIIYHNMFCVATDFGKFIYSEFDYTTEEMTGSLADFINEDGFREVSYLNNTNSFSAFATSKVVNDSTKDENAELFVSDRGVDAKYYRKVKPFTPAVGEVLEAFGEVKFEIK